MKYPSVLWIVLLVGVAHASCPYASGGKSDRSSRFVAWLNSAKENINSLDFIETLFHKNLHVTQTVGDIAGHGDHTARTSLELQKMWAAWFAPPFESNESWSTDVVESGNTVVLVGQHAVTLPDGFKYSNQWVMHSRFVGDKIYSLSLVADFGSLFQALAAHSK